MEDEGDSLGFQSQCAANRARVSKLLRGWIGWAEMNLMATLDKSYILGLKRMQSCGLYLMGLGAAGKRHMQSPSTAAIDSYYYITYCRDNLHRASEEATDRL